MNVQQEFWLTWEQTHRLDIEKDGGFVSCGDAAIIFALGPGTEGETIKQKASNTINPAERKGNSLLFLPSAQDVQFEHLSVALNLELERCGGWRR